MDQIVCTEKSIIIQGNNLLEALRADDRRLIEPVLQHWSADAHSVLYEPGDDVRHAYFPRGSTLVSYLVAMEDGREVETALIGREGAIGGIVSNGRLPSFSRARVHSGGDFFRVPSMALEKIKLASTTLAHLFSRYSDCMLAQVFQSVACNATHSIEQRTAKWILAAADRTGLRDMPMTQEQMAGMLGVSRSYVNRVIKIFREEGVLDVRRGAIRVMDIEKLRSLSCHCNALVTAHFDEVLAGVYPHNADE